MGATKLQTLAQIEAMRAKGEEFCVVTVVRTANTTSAKAGAKAIVTADGTVHGFIGGGCVHGAAKRAGLRALHDDEPRLIRVRPREDVIEPAELDGIELHNSGCPSGGTVDLFLEPVRKQMRLFICGTSPVAVSLAGLAKSMGYRTVLVAPSEDHGLVTDADDYHDGFDPVSLGVRTTDAIVVATQGKRDREALEGALRTASFYVGMVGSRRKIGVLLDQLANDIPAEPWRTFVAPPD